MPTSAGAVLTAQLCATPTFDGANSFEGAYLRGAIG